MHLSVHFYSLQSDDEKKMSLSSLLEASVKGKESFIQSILLHICPAQAEDCSTVVKYLHISLVVCCSFRKFQEYSTIVAGRLDSVCAFQDMHVCYTEWNCSASIRLSGVIDHIRECIAWEVLKWGNGWPCAAG